MPRGDGTGSNGMGSMTGKKFGYCVGYKSPGYLNCGSGHGRGMGRRFNSNDLVNHDVLDKKVILNNQKDLLEKQLQKVENQLKNFEENK
ncbi:MAG: DUF5320 domain-containing protein [Clostridiales bacterium]